MIRLITNIENSVRQSITEGLAWCSEFKVASAFLTDGGFYILSEDILRFVARGGKIRLVIGIENSFTDYNAILEFATLVGDCRCKLYKSSPEQSVTSFHPKIYVFSRTNERRAILGSSNLTRGGLLTNVEANVFFDESKFNREVLTQIDGFFDWLWERPNALAVEENDEFLEGYRIASQRNKRRIQKAAKEVATEGGPLGVELATSIPDRPQILDSSEALSDVRSSYLLGLVCGKGNIDRKARSISFLMENHLTADGKIKGIYTELDTHESHRYAVEVLRDLVSATTGSFGEKVGLESEESATRSQIATKITIQFARSSKLFKIIRDSFKGQADNSRFVVPDTILNSETDMRRSFLRGYADVASLISPGTRVFGSGKYRIYINVYHRNQALFDGLMNLLTSINVPGHPHDRHNTAEYDQREWQIRVYPEDFRTIGYNVAWKKRLLYDFIRANTSKSDNVTGEFDLK